MIHLLGQGNLLAKTDLNSEFRLLPIYPRDFDLFGFIFVSWVAIISLTNASPLVVSFLVL